MTKALLKLCILAMGWSVALLWAHPAQAHRLNVFAYAEGDAIFLESSFNSGRPAMGATVTLTDETSGDVLATGETDDKGACSMPIPAKAREGRLDLEVVVDAGGGHKGSWPLAAAEYLGADAAATAAAPPMDADAAPRNDAPAQVATGGVPAMDEAVLARVVEAAVEKKIAPMRAMLMEAQMAGPGVAEVVGGIGWIFGLMGVAAYMKSRRG
ncbi:MAG: hypothetical protein AB7E47_14265 [Desulfovibrionaceae bacterium]